MKKKSILLTLGITLAVWQVAIASSPTFMEAMQQKIGQMYQSQTLQEFVDAANAFERIAKAEPEKWEPVYYAAYSYINAGMRAETPEKKDQLLDRAMELSNTQLARKFEVAEFAVLKGWVYSIKISVDPASRGQEYSQKAYAEIGKAMQMNPNNPRAAFMKASMDFGTAQFFGNDPSEICDQFVNAQELADKEEMKSPIWPAWASGAIGYYLQQCK
jgi:hypothetical protein